MPEADKIKAAIRELAWRRGNVTLSEIEWIVNKLREFLPVNIRKATHGTLFRVGPRRFMINAHNPGNKQVKSYSVDDFIEAMTDLGWYEEE